MKKMIAMLLAVMLCVTGAALAESTLEGENTKFHTLIEDGEFIIQIDSEGDLAWVADDMAQDPSVVELAFMDTVEDTFVARYAPVGDGDMTVGVRHFSGAACDEVMTYDLRVVDGAVQEVIGGSYTASPADEEIDPYFAGEWLEQDGQAARLNVEKNPERGWDAAVVADGAYVFKTSVLYDCERNAFVYDKGKFWDIDGEYDDTVELGEARAAGTTGSFAFTGDEENPGIEWHDDVENPEGSILFARGAAEAAGDVAFEDPHGDLAFSYNPEAFEVTDEESDDAHNVVLTGTKAEWGEYSIAFNLRELADGEAAPELGSYGDDLEEGAEATQGEWNGFENVITYTNATDTENVQVLVVPVKDAEDGEVEDVLTISITAQKLEDEDAAMERDDNISAVLDSLKLLDD